MEVDWGAVLKDAITRAINEAESARKHQRPQLPDERPAGFWNEGEWQPYADYLDKMIKEDADKNPHKLPPEEACLKIKYAPEENGPSCAQNPPRQLFVWDDDLRWHIGRFEAYDHPVGPRELAYALRLVCNELDNLWKRLNEVNSTYCKLMSRGLKVVLNDDEEED